MRCLQFAALTAAFLCAACAAGTADIFGTTDTGPQPGEVTQDTTAVDSGVDVAPAEIVAEVEPDLVFDGVPETVEPACKPGQGCFLDPCEDGKSCLSGWCVEHLGDAVCTQLCQEECPQGWACKEYGQGPDVVFLCISNHANLCKPCAAGSDCKSVGGADDVCVSYGTEGSFCGGVCDTDADCPWGFSCKEALTVDGISTLQCTSDTGSCPCSGKAVERALWTPCTVSNDFGSCTGKRICAQDGLLPCDAALPVEETCNGLDDDCDGDVDEPDIVDGESVSLCDDGNSCTKDACAADTGCSHENLTGVECIDGDSCTVGDHCQEGACIGAPVLCDDKNPCTDDLCTITGGCDFVPNAAACDDTDPCTVNDTCKAGACGGFAVDCECDTDADCAALEDGDACNGSLVCDTAKLPHLCKVKPGSIVACTDPPDGPDAACLEPWCDPATGSCSLVPAHSGNACDDGDACTMGDACLDGTCVAGVAVNCLDDNPCTDDGCNAQTGCTHPFNTAPCNDADPCTVTDACALGACTGTGAPSCDDANPCTDDTCVPGKGCSSTANVADCDDGNACTLGDHCAAGQCTSVAITACDDGNPCTTDTCDADAGCVYTLNSLPCDDGSACTSGDTCKLGACAAGPEVECDDGNPCTDDVCNPKSGCLHTANTAGCDDGNACTPSSTCKDKACVGQGTVSCTDGNVCTDDSCDPKNGCVHAINTAPCSDGNACTTVDTCDKGVCTGQNPLVCNDDNPCTDDSCNSLTGCVFSANAAPCNDGNACTLDAACKNKVCTAVKVLSCADGDPCTDDSCDPVAGCTHTLNTAACDDGDVCTTGDACTLGVCKGKAPLSCDDGNPCTDDSCTPLAGCVHTANTAACDDGNACTTGDTCVKTVCEGKGTLSCNDSNFCTDNQCDPKLGCVFPNNTLPCNDANACTTVDVCKDGSCQGTVPPVCDAAAWCLANKCIATCVNASCVPASGCKYDLLPGCCGNGITEPPEACDDGNAQNGDGCSALCKSELASHWQLTGNPDPSVPFNAISVCFRYPNNLTNGIWHSQTNTIVVGEFSTPGYWAHKANTGGYPSSPNNGSGYYGRMVIMPGNNLVAYSIVGSNDGMNSATAQQLRLATINVNTGLLGSPYTPVYSDSYTGWCNVLSSSATELFCYDGTSVVRKYLTKPGSGDLALQATVTLSGQALPSGAGCNNGHCYAGTFAWDGKYMYFADGQTGSNNLKYWVYNADGTFKSTYTMSGGGGVNGLYFDWSVGRYAIHDGYGYRTGGTVYDCSGGGTSDSQCYGTTSPWHTPVL